jgi:hypothetical protein
VLVRCNIYLYASRAGSSTKRAGAGFVRRTAAWRGHLCMVRLQRAVQGSSLVIWKRVFGVHVVRPLREPRFFRYNCVIQTSDGCCGRPPVDRSDLYDIPTEGISVASFGVHALRLLPGSQVQVDISLYQFNWGHIIIWAMSCDANNRHDSFQFSTRQPAKPQF